MEILRPDDPRAFLDVARPLLAGDADREARHNLILGIARTLAEEPTLYPKFRLWLVREDGIPVAAGLMTPPFNVVLAEPASDRGLAALVQAIVADDAPVPGVVGNVPAVDRFAGIWSKTTGRRAHVAQAQGVYALRRVCDLEPPRGAPRSAGPADRELLLDWVIAFAEEAVREGGAGRDPEGLERRLDARLRSDVEGYWFWEADGEPVSLAGFGGPTPTGIRVGPVYTPPRHRRRGYATGLVAVLSRWLMDRGHRACFLYTDLANPTSNHIYVEVGYERVCDSIEYRFEAGETAPAGAQA